MAAPNPNPPAGPAVACNNENGNFIMEYNTNRLEMLGFAMKLRRWLAMPHEQQNEVRNEILLMFREFGRANPNAGLGEMEGLQLLLRLAQPNATASTTEFAHAVSRHQVLVNAFRKIRDYI